MVLLNHFHLDLTTCLASSMVLFALALQGEARIKVMSSLIDETVYIVDDKPIITNADVPSKGILVLANPANACSPISPATLLPTIVPVNSSLATPTMINNASESEMYPFGPDSFSWILLVSWVPDDDCSIRIKAETAAAAGYNILVLQDPSNLEKDSEPFLSPLSSSTTAFDYAWTNIDVYASIVNPEDWEILKNNFTSDEYYLTFDESNSMGGWFTYFIVGVLAIGAVFFTIGLSYVLVQLLVLILLWIRESIVSRIQQIRRDRRRRLPASQLRKIPITLWNSDMLQDICSICLETFVPTERVRILPCAHVFHQCCIDPWLLKQRRKCPNCKRKIIFPDENRDSDSSSDDERTPLLRRNSSTSTSRAAYAFPNEGTHRRSDERRSMHQSSGIHRFLSSTMAATSRHGQNSVGGASCDSQHHPDQDQVPPGTSLDCSFHSARNVSAEVGDNATAPTTCEPDLKDKVDQLCSRMENVGRKIKKKAKANQATKLDNDSSSDLSTSVQPVLVAVTVEQNHILDSDCEQSHEESQFKEEPSTSNANCYSYSPSQHQPSKPGSELEIKVVPEGSSSSSMQTLIGDSENNRLEESSIPTDLNA